MSNGFTGSSRTTTNTRSDPTLHQLLLPGQQPPRRPPAVIDLTVDSPPHAQQYHHRAPEMQRHEIIDVDALPDRPTLPTLHPPTQTHSYTYNYNPHYDARHTLGGRVGDRSYHRYPAPYFPAPPMLQAPRSRRLPTRGPGGGGPTLRDLLRTGMPDLVAQVVRRQHESIQRGTMPVLPQRRPTQFRPPPTRMDYEATALGFGAKPEPRPFEETYEEPPKARPGFTRSPTENDVLVCAQVDCDQELGVAEDENDERGLVYVGKCGHVYCGPCGTKLQKTRAGRKDARSAHDPPPPGFCAVTGCPQKLTGKQIWKVHL
ncbi:hypothetical protein BJ508DRAFT_327079 [Ascobolus immersus RN42]|uniref:Uncharacterized protein n=1 Tax=Ascobolus immersus RN42 TaxID=1160509 RepID=A0A3N4I5L7_ASCIM|nr:hypothetical protein BJ508DRAFT_327079 [Ascobolus immersus RN42]